MREPFGKFKRKNGKAARVHDWHAFTDRTNANVVRNNGKYLTSYSPWSDDWGTKPASCPACGDTILGFENSALFST